MSDLIKKIKIKKQDGTYTDHIPIGAEAKNVDCSDGESVEYKLNKKPYYYNNVADMKADTKLKVGDMAITLGYYEPHDGGNCEYKIVNGIYTDNGGNYHELINGLFAELIIKDEVNVKQFGAYGNGIADDTNSFIEMLNSNYKTILIPSGTYMISSTLTIVGKNILGEKDTILKAKMAVENLVNIQKHSYIDNVKFDGNFLAEQCILGNDFEYQGSVLENCKFWNMNTTGLYVAKIGNKINNCEFGYNKGTGLTVYEVGNFVSNCFSYVNNGAGIDIVHGTNIITSCKVYENGDYGFILSGDYISIDACESQQNRKGSLYVGPFAKNCCVTNFNSLGECNIKRTDMDKTQYPIIKLLGGHNYIQMTVTAFHFYRYPRQSINKDWIGYPNAYIDIETPLNWGWDLVTNNHVEITTNFDSSSYQEVQNIYPNLSFVPIRTLYNQGQSNKFIIDGNEYRKYLISSYETNITSAHSTKIGNDNKDFIIAIDPSFLNGISTLNTDNIACQFSDNLYDKKEMKLYSFGYAYPLNYKDYFDIRVSSFIKGTVNGEQITASGGPDTNSGQMDNVDSTGKFYNNYIIHYGQHILNKAGYEANSLKAYTTIWIKKTAEITATEPLLIACKNLGFAYDQGTYQKYEEEISG